MNYTRSNRVGVVWRKTIKEKLVGTVFGGKSVDVKRCKCCKQYLPKTDFYFESKSKSKFPEQLRNICIFCYDENNGRYLTKNSETQYSSIEKFL